MGMVGPLGLTWTAWSVPAFPRRGRAPLAPGRVGRSPARLWPVSRQRPSTETDETIAQGARSAQRFPAPPWRDAKSLVWEMPWSVTTRPSTAAAQPSLAPQKGRRNASPRTTGRHDQSTSITAAIGSSPRGLWGWKRASRRTGSIKPRSKLPRNKTIPLPGLRAGPGRKERDRTFLHQGNFDWRNFAEKVSTQWEAGRHRPPRVVQWGTHARSMGFDEWLTKGGGRISWVWGATRDMYIRGGFAKFLILSCRYISRLKMFRWQLWEKKESGCKLVVQERWRFHIGMPLVKSGQRAKVGSGTNDSRKRSWRRHRRTNRYWRRWVQGNFGQRVYVQSQRIQLV